MAKNGKKNQQAQNKKTNAKQQVKKYVNAKISIPADTPEKVSVEVLAIVQATPFDKISFPLSAYRGTIGTKEGDDDNRVSTVGYIRKFDLEKNQFQVVIFNGNKERIEAFKNPIIIPVFTMHNESLGTITKLIIDEAVENETAEPAPEVEATPEAENVQAEAEEAKEDEPSAETVKKESKPKKKEADEEKEKPVKPLGTKITIPDEVKEQVAQS